jgi:hypothetical protein
MRNMRSIDKVNKICKGLLSEIEELKAQLSDKGDAIRTQRATIAQKDREIAVLRSCKEITGPPRCIAMEKEITELKEKLKEWRNAAPYHITERIQK